MHDTFRRNILLVVVTVEINNFCVPYGDFNDRGDGPNEKVNRLTGSGRD